MKFFFSKSAIKDLIRVKEFIAKDNPKVAARVITRIQQVIAQLVIAPKIGKVVMDLEQVREFVAGDYVVRYLIKSNTIYIARIWHGKEYRDYK